jgi:hypothetical protein
MENSLPCFFVGAQGKGCTIANGMVNTVLSCVFYHVHNKPLCGVLKWVHDKKKSIDEMTTADDMGEDGLSCVLSCAWQKMK